LEKTYKVSYSLSGRDETEGFSQENILATYIHLHFRANPKLAGNFVSAIQHARALQVVTV
jgi:cobyrinic acid a,c-diamide synthase